MILGMVFDGVLSVNTGVSDMMCVDKKQTYFIYTVLILIQSNFNGSNTFGTMKIWSRQGWFEPLRVYYRVRSGGIIRISFRLSSA